MTCVQVCGGVCPATGECSVVLCASMAAVFGVASFSLLAWTGNQLRLVLQVRTLRKLRWIDWVFVQGLVFVALFTGYVLMLVSGTSPTTTLLALSLYMLSTSGLFIMIAWVVAAWAQATRGRFADSRKSFLRVLTIGGAVVLLVFVTAGVLVAMGVMKSLQDIQPLWLLVTVGLALLLRRYGSKVLDALRAAAEMRGASDSDESLRRVSTTMVRLGSLLLGAAGFIMLMFSLGVSGAVDMTKTDTCNGFGVGFCSLILAAFALLMHPLRTRGKSVHGKYAESKKREASRRVIVEGSP